MTCLPYACTPLLRNIISNFAVRARFNMPRYRFCRLHWAVNDNGGNRVA